MVSIGLFVKYIIVHCILDNYKDKDKDTKKKSLVQQSLRHPKEPFSMNARTIIPGGDIFLLLFKKNVAWTKAKTTPSSTTTPPPHTTMGNGRDFAHSHQYTSSPVTPCDIDQCAPPTNKHLKCFRHLCLSVNGSFKNGKKNV